MIRVNEGYLKLQSSYLFADIAKRVSAFTKAHPEREIIRMGIGDVTRALPRACIDAFHKGVDDMAADATFKGYGPDYGYEFLREKIAAHDYQRRGAGIAADEVFVSDGAKCDTANIQELFATDLKVAVPDPVYPVYVDTNVMAGRTATFRDGRYNGLVYLECTKENGFVAPVTREKVDLIYLCFPNNPTGATITTKQLQAWVDYARDAKALILYDAAYEVFIRDAGVPHSIYEIEGARKVAIEFRSFSKTAGFTGTRCAYTVVPKDCIAWDSNDAEHSLHAMWSRRQSTKMNGVSYPVQRAAEAVYSPEGQQQVKEAADYYLKNAASIRKTFERLGYAVAGGRNAPYVWVQTGRDSWEFFDTLLDKAGVVCTPGAGFGKCGAGYARFSAFNSQANTEKALEKIAATLKP
jgi:LL-diaminopimelate aminotransferase